MLGVLRMDIETCINAYLSMAREIFPVEGMVSKSFFGKAKKYVLSGAFPLLLLCFLIRHLA